MGGPLFAYRVVADLQVGAFAFRGPRIASLKTGHYKIEQLETGSSPGLPEEPTVYSRLFDRGGTIGKSNRRDDDLAGRVFVEVIRVSAPPRHFVERKRRA
jgi:hypothetical protein